MERQTADFAQDAGKEFFLQKWKAGFTVESAIILNSQKNKMAVSQKFLECIVQDIKLTQSFISPEDSQVFKGNVLNSLLMKREKSLKAVYKKITGKRYYNNSRNYN